MRQTVVHNAVPRAHWRTIMQRHFKWLNCRQTLIRLQLLHCRLARLSKIIARQLILCIRCLFGVKFQKRTQISKHTPYLKKWKDQTRNLTRRQDKILSSTRRQNTQNSLAKSQNSKISRQKSKLQHRKPAKKTFSLKILKLTSEIQNNRMSKFCAQTGITDA